MQKTIYPKTDILKIFNFYFCLLNSKLCALI